jgi:uncharacterized phosphosugar-binding protein
MDQGEETAGIEYLDVAIGLLQRLRETQAASIRGAATIIADAIEAGGFAHFCGAGHSHMALEEAFPRNGGLVGLHPLTELALAYYTPVIGPAGANQMRFFQEVEGLGEVLWKTYRFKPTDCFVVFTNTGVTKVMLDIAHLAKQHGHRVIGVTSLQHADATGTNHQGGKRLHEIADIVIDNCSPPGGAAIPIPGIAERCGATSTVTVISIVNALATESAKELARRNVEPLVLASPYFEGTDEDVLARRHAAERQWERCMDAYKARYRELL